jgi:hypothetical protein
VVKQEGRMGSRPERRERDHLQCQAPAVLNPWRRHSQGRAHGIRYAFRPVPGRTREAFRRARICNWIVSARGGQERQQKTWTAPQSATTRHAKGHFGSVQGFTRGWRATRVVVPCPVTSRRASLPGHLPRSPRGSSRSASGNDRRSYDWSRNSSTVKPMSLQIL